MGADHYHGGDYLVVAAGATHPPVRSEGGALAYIRATIADAT